MGGLRLALNASTTVYHTFPGDNDSDRDKLNDGDEVHKYLTDPANADTDCDGVDDGIEVSAGTDPLHAADGSNCDGPGGGLLKIKL